MGRHTFTTKTALQQVTTQTSIAAVEFGTS